MSAKIIINFSPTGMVPTRALTPHVPITPAEIIEEVHQAHELGITLVHLHARDEQELPTWDPQVYQRIIEGVRKHCPGLVIGASTSGRNFPEFEKRSAVIELRPDMCSLTLSSLNFVTQASPNSPDMIRRLAQKMKEYGVKPEFEAFDFGMINYGLYLIRKGLADRPFYWNLFFGNIAGMQSNLAQIGVALAEIRGEEHYVALGGIGRSQLPVNATAIANGYGVRTGLEDNIWFDAEETVKATNINLLKRVHSLIELHGMELFKSAEFGRADSTMAGRLCLLGFSANVLSLIFNTLQALASTQELIIVENLHGEDSTPYDCGLSHHRVWYEDFTRRAGDTFFFGVGGASIKPAVFDFFAARFAFSRDDFVNLIHPSVQLAHQHHLAHGIHLEPGCIISPFADVGFGVTVLRGSSIGHHTRIGEFTSFSPGVHIAGHTHIGARTTIGIGTVVFDHISIGADCLIGGGSVVSKDIPDGVVAYGTPCRVVRERNARSA